MRYRVLVREVHVSHRIVEAPGPEEAKIVAAMEGDEDYCEYSHTLDADTWTVEPEKESTNDLREGDECPNCKCGTVERTDKAFVCKGECGAFFRDADAPHVKED